MRSRIGRHEGAAGDGRLGIGIAGDDARARGFELGDLGADVVALATLTSAPMRVSSSRGSPTLVFASRSRERLLDRVEIVRPAPWRGGWRCISAPP